MSAKLTEDFQMQNLIICVLLGALAAPAAVAEQLCMERSQFLHAFQSIRVQRWRRVGDRQRHRPWLATLPVRSGIQQRRHCDIAARRYLH